MPCTQFFTKRCIAPCVKELCGESAYNARALLASIFLENDREAFSVELRRQIEDASEKLDFEKAAELRDIGAVAEKIQNDRRFYPWLDNAVDSIIVERSNDDITAFIITERGRRMLGMRVFTWSDIDEYDPSQILLDLIRQFYLHHTPKEIRVSHEFAGRSEMSRELSDRAGRKVRIIIKREYTPTTVRSLLRSRLEADLAVIGKPSTVAELRRDLKRIFRLKKQPRRIECLDAAHISGTNLVIARSVWLEGRFAVKEYLSKLSMEKNEINALRNIGDLVSDEADLVVIDGGIAHLNAAIKGLGGEKKVDIIAAVKPANHHDEISHFILSDGVRIEYRRDLAAMQIIKTLRDEAHFLANSTHAQIRDSELFYSQRGVDPVIVPIRYIDPDGLAEDLRPIKVNKYNR